MLDDSKWVPETGASPISPRSPPDPTAAPLASSRHLFAWLGALAPVL